MDFGCGARATLTTEAHYAAKAGSHIVIPYRDEDEKRHLRVCGDLGQITSLVRSLYCIERRLDASEAVDSMTEGRQYDRNGILEGLTRLRSV